MIYLFYGLDNYRSREKIRELVVSYKKAHNQTADLKIFDFDNEKVQFSALKDSSQTMSLFKTKRLFILENFFGNQTEDFKEKFIENFDFFLLSEDILVFHENAIPRANDALFKRLLAKAKCLLFEPLSGAKLDHWIEKKVQEYGCLIEAQAKKALELYVGSDLWRMDNEIKKACAYCNRGQIRLEDVKLLVRPNIESEIFKTMDCLSRRDLKAATASLLRHIKNGDAPQYLFYMVTNQFRSLLLIKDMQEKGENFPAMAKTLALPPFIVSKLAGFSGNFTLQELKEDYNLLKKLDVDTKTGRIEPDTALEVFLSKACA